MQFSWLIAETKTLKWEQTLSVQETERRSLWLKQSEQEKNMQNEERRSQIWQNLVGHVKNFEFYSRGEDFKQEGHMI